MTRSLVNGCSSPLTVSYDAYCFHLFAPTVHYGMGLLVNAPIETLVLGQWFNCHCDLVENRVLFDPAMATAVRFQLLLIHVNVY